MKRKGRIRIGSKSRDIVADRRKNVDEFALEVLVSEPRAIQKYRSFQTIQNYRPCSGKRDCQSGVEEVEEHWRMSRGSRRIPEEHWDRLCEYKLAEMVLQSAEGFVKAEEEVDCRSVLPRAR